MFATKNVQFFSTRFKYICVCVFLYKCTIISLALAMGLSEESVENLAAPLTLKE